MTSGTSLRRIDGFAGLSELNHQGDWYRLAKADCGGEKLSRTTKAESDYHDGPRQCLRTSGRSATLSRSSQYLRLSPKSPERSLLGPSIKSSRGSSCGSSWDSRSCSLSYFLEP